MIPVTTFTTVGTGNNLTDTIAKAHTGGVIKVASGEYTGSIGLANRKFTKSNPLVIACDEATLTGGYLYPTGAPAIGSRDRFRAHDGELHTGEGFVWQGLIHLRNCAHIHFIGLNIEKSRGGGIVLDGCEGIKFLDGHIKHCRHAAARVLSSRDIELAPTEVHDCANFAPISRDPKIMNWPVIVNTTHDSTDVLICDAWIWGNYGEGIGSGQNIRNLVWQDLTVGPNLAMGAYLHEGHSVTMRRCLLYHDQSNTYNRGATPSPLLVVNREMSIATNPDNGDHVVEDCYFAPRSDSVGIDMWRNQGDAGQTGPLRFRRNVVVSRGGYCLRSRGNIAPLHKDTEFEGNLFARLDGGPCYDDRADGKQPIDGMTVRFVGNAWSKAPPASMRGEGDAAAVVNPNAVQIAERIPPGGKPEMEFGKEKPMPIEPEPTPIPVTPSGRRSYYISNDGDNSDGLTIETAWQDWGAAEWHPRSDYYVLPGMYYDPIEPDCGDVRILGLGCTADEPAIIKGERDGVLPECGRTDHVAESAIENGARVRYPNITIDGRSLQGFIFRNWIGNGIRCDKEADDFVLANAEIYNNGWTVLDDEGRVVTKGAGLLIAGKMPAIVDVIIHDNGEDCIQSAHGNNGLRGIALDRVWTYNALRHSVVVDEAKNYITHTDGLQIYAGEAVRQIVATDCWFGPGHTNCVILGDVSTGTTVRGVTFRDCTFDRGADNCLLNNPPQQNDNHIYDHITVVSTKTKLHAIFSDGDNVKILDSIVEGQGDINLSGTRHTFRGNHACGVALNAGTDGFGTEHSGSLLPRVRSTSAFELNDYTPRDGISAGSRNHRVQDIFGLSDHQMVGPDAYGRYRFVAPEDADESSDAGQPSADDAAFAAYFEKMQTRLHADAVANGWYDDASQDDELAFVTRLVANLHSEVSEFWDKYVKGELDGSELADLVIRAMGGSEWLKVDLGGEIVAKRAKNKTRGYRHGGKKA